MPLTAPDLALPAFDRFQAGVLAGVVALGALYLCGALRLRASEAGRRALPGWRAGALATAWTVLVLGLAPPVQRLADALFSAHMAQHELFLVLAPPFFVLGRPMLVALWGLPAGLRRRLARPLRRPGAATAWRTLTAPAVAFGLQAVLLWLWHAGPAFEGALSHDAVHLVQHGTFFASAVLFWWALLHGRFGRLGYGAGVLFVFLTAVHSGALGALLFVSPRPWYPTHAARAATAGVEPLVDQQLGGLLMWVPAGAVLIVLGLALFRAWLAEAERRVRSSRLQTGPAGFTGAGAAVEPRRRVFARQDDCTRGRHGLGSPELR